MAARFWVTGGTGNWNDTSNWSATSGGSSGASVPGSADTATLNANSGSGTVTLNISPTIQTLTCTGFTGTLAFGTNTISLNSTGTIFTGVTTMTVTGTPQIICTNSSATSRTITPTAVTEANSISFRITAGTGTLSLTAGGYRDLDFTDGTNPTGYAGALGNTAISIYGNFKASTGMTRSAGATTYTFAATSGTKTINTAGVTFNNPFTFNGVGGTWQLQAALTSGATRAITLTNGALNTNGYSVTAGTFSSNNTNTRTLTLGASTVTLTNAANGSTPWNLSDSTNMTLNAGTSTISLSTNTINASFAGGGLTYYNLTFPASYYNVAISGANTFNNLTLDSPAGAGRRSLSFSANQTISGTLSCSGSAANSRPRLVGAAGGTTLTVASVSLANADFNAIIAAGASSPWSGTNLGNFGSNTNITFATPKTIYWNQPAGGNWSDVAWATSSGGAVNINNFPLGQDTAVLDNTGVGASSTIVMDYGWILPSISAGSLTNALTINWNTFNTLAAGCAGSTVTLSSAITFAFTGGSTAFNPLSNATVTTAGVIFPMTTTIVGAPGATVTLADNFTCTGKVNIVAGTINLNGNTLTGDNFDGTFTDLEVRAIAFNGGQINVTGNSATVWAFEDLTNFSYTGTPTVNFTYSGSTGTRTINNGTTGATESNVVDFNVTAGSDQWTATAPNSVRNLNFTGFSGTTGLFGSGFIYGNLTLSPTQTITASSNSTTFAATSGTKTITTNGVTIDRPLTFNGVGGSWSLQDDLTLGSTRTMLLLAGTLTTNNYAVSCGKFGTSAANGDRTLNLGSSSFTCFGGTTASASWQVADSGFSYTLNAGTSTIYLAEPFTGASEQYFYGGGKTYYNVVFSTTQPGGFYDSNTFNSISNTAQPLTLGFQAGSTQTVNNFSVSGTAGNLVTLQSETPGTRWNLAKNTGGKVLVSYVSITDSAATPAGYWFAPTSQGNVDGGNNTGWNFGTVGGAGGFLPFF
jgi:hypothetical protein